MFNFHPTLPPPLSLSIQMKVFQQIVILQDLILIFQLVLLSNDFKLLDG